MNMQNILSSGEKMLERMIQDGNWMCGYFIQDRRCLLPDSIARQFGLNGMIENFPDWVLEHGGVAEESVGAWKELFDRIHSGQAYGGAMLSLKSDRTTLSRLWMRFNAVSDEDGRPGFAMITFDDFTLLTRQLETMDNDINGLLHVAGKTFPEVMILNLTKGSYRTVQSSANITPDLPREGSFEDMHLLRRSYVVEEDREVFANTLGYEGLRKAFIQDGREEVQLAYRRIAPGSGLCWMETTVTRQQNTRNDDLLLVAMVRNVDEQKAREIRMKEEIRIRSEELRITMSKMGKVISYYDIPSRRYTLPQYICDEWPLPNPYPGFPEKFLKENPIGMDEDMLSALGELFDRILSGAPSGSCEYCFTTRKGNRRWERLEFATIFDDRERPLRAVIATEDVTQQVEMKRRAERDGMTGLLNRGTAEAIIRGKIASGNSNGILIVLDLDDLKGINDTLGHNGGDQAIISIADTLKAHFRETDVIVRFGGDEFVVFLPGAAASSDAIAVSIAGLLRKLSGIAIGENGQRRIHCSVGCAVQTDGNTSFDTLYRQADTALYHVKRTGKNNFAFYSPEMEQVNYQFQAKHLFSRKIARKYEAAELHQLLQAVAKLYQLVMSVNLSANDYYLMEEIEGGVFAGAPTFGVLDDFIDAVRIRLHPEDEALFMQTLSRRALLDAYAAGKDRVFAVFRFRIGEIYRKVEASVVLYENEVGNACEFSLMRFVD